MNPFRHHHLFKLLTSFELSPLPLDVFLSQFFRSHKAIGSKDRSYICEKVYQLIRWQALLDHVCEKPITWEKRLHSLLERDLSRLSQDLSISPHIRASFPKVFFDKIASAFGEQQALQFCFTSNESAPITIRINPLKTTRKELLELWAPLYPITPCQISPYGITFKKRTNFFELAEFKSGYFEVQDEGSQLVAAHIEAKPGDHILDFCAGAGGKTLAFAHLLQGKGQIYLYDIRPHALLQAKKRLKRAGIQNAQYLDSKKLKKPSMLGKMDWILLDVPCSGTGTIRRNPDMKWHFSDSMVQELVCKQRDILAQVLPYLAPHGKIVYATCSVLPEENFNQIEFFTKNHPLKLVGTPFFSLPQSNGMDGFFAAVLELR